MLYEKKQFAIYPFIGGSEMDSVSQQTLIISNYYASGDYAGAYRYIASQIEQDPNWDSRLVPWFNRAADINGPVDNFWKEWVFTSNALAAGMDPDSSTARQLNQDVSDELARNILEDYLDAIEHGEVLTPRTIYETDVASAVRGFGIPEWAWAGGPLGAIYGFPVGYVYDTLGELFDLARNALETADHLLDDYQNELFDLLPRIPDSLADHLILDPIDLAKLGLDLIESISDLLRDALYDPLVLDLDGDGIELIALGASSAHFDLDEDGVAERAGWVSPHDGLLVQDSNGNGLVDGVAELIGSGTVDGFVELATLDSNADGKVDSNDPAFTQLRVWRDLNADGTSTADEMLTLAQAGITRFNLASTLVNSSVGGNVIARTGSYVKAADAAALRENSGDARAGWRTILLERGFDEIPRKVPPQRRSRGFSQLLIDIGQVQ